MDGDALLLFPDPVTFISDRIAIKLKHTRDGYALDFICVA